MTAHGRRLFVSLCLALATGLGFVGIAPQAHAQMPFNDVSASEPRYAAIVVDANSGEVLYAKNADAQRYPASITKVMTLYLTFEALASGQLSLKDTLTVSPRAAAQAPTKLGLRAGETISVDDAIHAVTLKSANDMAVALAERIGGTESRFAALMTLRAHELGMVNTRYVNASGLPDSRQLSSARDIAILSRAVMRDYPQYYSFFSLREANVHGQLLKSHNHVMLQMPGVDGIKTGFTNASGYNLAASAVRNNRRLIAVMLGGNSAAARDNHVEDLLDTGFEVLNRRAHGEVITVAQNLFEPAPTGTLMKPSVDQGDAGEQPQARAAKTTGKTAAADNDKGARWLVQVGAYRRKGEARSEMKRIAHKFAARFGAADAQVVDGEGGRYRVRFAGMTAADARSACATLKSSGQTCTAIGPN